MCWLISISKFLPGYLIGFSIWMYPKENCWSPFTPASCTLKGDPYLILFGLFQVSKWTLLRPSGPYAELYLLNLKNKKQNTDHFSHSHLYTHTLIIVSISPVNKQKTTASSEVFADTSEPSSPLLHWPVAPHMAAMGMLFKYMSYHDTSLTQSTSRVSHLTWTKL